MKKLNTSNLGKFQEFVGLFNKHGIQLEATHIDLKEIIGSATEIVAHKASQLEDEIIVDDTSLEIEGASIGTNVKWLMDHLESYVGRKAIWSVLLAFKKEENIYIFKGEIQGKIVPPRGESNLGFDPLFLPDGAELTLAEAKPDKFSARAKAVTSLIKNEIYMIHPLIVNWDGRWQDQSI